MLRRLQRSPFLNAFHAELMLGHRTEGLPAMDMNWIGQPPGQDVLPPRMNEDPALLASIDEDLRQASAAIDAALVAPMRAIKAQHIARAMAHMAEAQRVQRMLEVAAQREG